MCCALCVWLPVFKHWFWEVERERKNKCPLASSLPKCLQKSILGWVKARSLELNVGLPHGWQELNYLSHHHCCVLGSAWTGTGVSSQSCVLNLSSLIQDMDILTGDFTVRPNTHLETWCFIRRGRKIRKTQIHMCLLSLALESPASKKTTMWAHELPEPWSKITLFPSYVACIRYSTTPTPGRWMQWVSWLGTCYSWLLV